MMRMDLDQLTQLHDRYTEAYFFMLPYPIESECIEAKRQFDTLMDYASKGYLLGASDYVMLSMSDIHNLQVLHELWLKRHNKDGSELSGQG